MRQKYMVQSLYCSPDCRCHKLYGLHRGDVVVYGTEVGKVESIATAWMKVPQVLVQFRDWQAWVPSESVTKI